MRNDTFGNWSRDIIKNYRKDQNDTKPTTFSKDFKLKLTHWLTLRLLDHSILGVADSKSCLSEFLEWWVDGTVHGSDNEHWQTYRNLLNPCLYQWDYILKLENIEEESKWLFAEFNITEIEYPPGDGKHGQNVF